MSDLKNDINVIDNCIRTLRYRMTDPNWEKVATKSLKKAKKDMQNELDKNKVYIPHRMIRLIEKNYLCCNDANKYHRVVVIKDLRLIIFHNYEMTEVAGLSAIPDMSMRSLDPLSSNYDDWLNETTRNIGNFVALYDCLTVKDPSIFMTDPKLPYIYDHTKEFHLDLDKFYEDTSKYSVVRDDGSIVQNYTFI